MADKEGFADWKWLVDFHARVLEGRGAKIRERRSTRARHPYFLSPGAAAGVSPLHHSITRFLKYSHLTP